ncbi:MAG: hypothetical protein ACOC16_01835 [Nanoarchaeota archaeon]
MKEYHSQIYQDKFIHKNIFKEFNKNLFIDTGAFDEIEYSNTYSFEKHLNWSGVCIEPIPKYFELLKKNRTCKKTQSFYKLSI